MILLWPLLDVRFKNIRWGINSDEFDDLDKGYECVYNPYHIIFIPDIMAIDMFDL